MVCFQLDVLYITSYVSSLEINLIGQYSRHFPFTFVFFLILYASKSSRNESEEKTLKGKIKRGHSYWRHKKAYTISVYLTNSRRWLTNSGCSKHIPSPCFKDFQSLKWDLRESIFFSSSSKVSSLSLHHHIAAVQFWRKDWRWTMNDFIFLVGVGEGWVLKGRASFFFSSSLSGC